MKLSIPSTDIFTAQLEIESGALFWNSQDLRELELKVNGESFYTIHNLRRVTKLHRL